MYNYCPTDVLKKKEKKKVKAKSLNNNYAFHDFNVTAYMKVHYRKKKKNMVTVCNVLPYSLKYLQNLYFANCLEVLKL